MNPTHSVTFPVLLLSLSLTVATASAAGPTTSPVLADRPSLWGQPVNGVQARLFMPAQVEQDALVPIRFEIADDPDRLPSSANRFDTFLLYTRVAVSMNDVKSGKSVTVTPPVASGVPTVNSGTDFVRLDGNPVKPFAMDIALRSAGARLEPGEYDCVLICPSDRSPPGWLIQPLPGPGREWWSGRVQTAPLRVKIVPATEKKRTLFLPKKAYLAKSQSNAGYDLRCEKQDVEAVEVPVRNGCYLGTRIGREGGASGLSEDAISFPDGGSLFDDPTNEQDARTKPGDKLTYTIEVFETNLPSGHAWLPVPGHDGYKTLWKRTFKVKVPSVAPAPSGPGR